MAGNALCYYLDFLLVRDQRIVHIAFSRVGLIAAWLNNCLAHPFLLWLKYSEKHDSTGNVTIESQ